MTTKVHGNLHHARVYGQDERLMMRRCNSGSFLLLLSFFVLTVANAPVAHSEILIATAGPFTGINLFRGEQIQRGAELAVENINARGGVLGEHLTLAIVDDACDPDQSVAVANKLVSDGVVFVAGHVCSHSSIPAGRIYGDAGVIMISPASTNPRLTDEGGPNVFRVCGRDDHQGRVDGNYLANEWKNGRIAILNDGSTYGRGLAGETQKQLNMRGVNSALEATFETGTRDYSKLIEQMQFTGIDDKGDITAPGFIWYMWKDGEYLPAPDSWLKR